jgi:hypothetical protein
MLGLAHRLAVAHRALILEQLAQRLHRFHRAPLSLACQFSAMGEF